MNPHSVTELLKNQALIGTQITVKGWVKTRRDSKAGISFININDGSCFDSIQAVAPNTLSNYATEITKITAGCAVIATGELVESQGKGQTIEIHATDINVVGWVDEPESYPVAAKHHTFEYLRDYAHLRTRTNTFGAVTRVRNCVAQAVHRFFHEQGFYWVHTPIITTNDCEGAGELFRVSTLDLVNLPRNEHGHVDFKQDFFGCETYLTVSGQLNVEAFCLALSNVYTFGPTFRAENSNTSRHLAEFWMIEPEIAFADLNDTATLAENMLKYLCTAVLEERQDDMAFFQQRIEKSCIDRLEAITNNHFEHMEYSEAIKILQQAKQKFEFPVQWGLDLQSEHERYIAEQHVGNPVIILNYPKQIKSFYMRVNDDNKTVAAMDVIAPGIGEIIGGSQREERLDMLDSRLEELDINKADYAWYRDLRRYGSVPHAGFGLGFERLIGYITGMANVRDVIPYPRTPGNAQF